MLPVAYHRHRAGHIDSAFRFVFANLPGRAEFLYRAGCPRMGSHTQSNWNSKTIPHHESECARDQVRTALALTIIAEQQRSTWTWPNCLRNWEATAKRLWIAARVGVLSHVETRY